MLQREFNAKLLFTNKQIRLIFLLTLLISTFISSASLFLYYDYRNKLDKELNQPNAELLRINLDVTNRAFRNYDHKAVQLSFHPLVADFVSSSGERKPEVAASLLSYLKASAFEEDIHSVYVADLTNHKVISSKAGQEQAFEEINDQSWLAWIKDMEKKPLLIKKRSTGDGSEASPARIDLISLYRPIRFEDKLVGLVVLNIDYDRLFTSIHTQLNAPQYIFNLDGELIYPKTNLPVTETDMHKVIEAIDIQPFKEVKLGKTVYLANQAFSDMTGWRWVSLISLEDLLKNARLVRNIIVMLSLLSIVIGCVAIYYYSFTASRPVKRIRELIGQDGKSHAPGDLHDIEQYIHKLIREFDLNSAISRESLPEIRAKYVQDVLFHRIGAKEIQFKWQRYFQEWTEAPLTAAIVSINRYKAWSAEFSEEDQLLLKYALNNLIHEIFEPDWNSIGITLDKENLLLIVQPKRSQPDSIQSAQAQFDKVIEMSRKYLHMQLSAGLGTPVPSISGLHRSYSEAAAALAYRLYAGFGKTICAHPVMQHKDFTEAQAEKVKREWLGCAESGESQELAESIKRWSEAVLEMRHSPDSVYSFADGWIELLAELSQTHDLLKPAALEDYTSHQLKMMDLEDLTALLLDVSVHTATALKNRLNRKEHSIVQRMIQYMRERLSENIGLQHIADSIQMSTSSVSSIFKQETGFSVYEYLTNLRIEEACRLLIETERKIADIAMHVGYQNETSFIRSFRKVKGMTPGKFREISKPY
ncbi:AraC family transcriptional regulator [Paenibacillus hamazuiensis]|uniref:AraC family transcriptional regulator n=1 Tax=Paenibacillus hamazuiensis TaxID=2936508 RepID=UPI002010510C|nr:AraC family transcriptional regulator [Paenibacillus hamazuiensis]